MTRSLVHIAAIGSALILAACGGSGGGSDQPGIPMFPGFLGGPTPTALNALLQVAATTPAIDPATLPLADLTVTYTGDVGFR